MMVSAYFCFLTIHIRKSAREWLPVFVVPDFMYPATISEPHTDRCADPISFHMKWGIVWAYCILLLLQMTHNLSMTLPVKIMKFTRLMETMFVIRRPITTLLIMLNILLVNIPQMEMGLLRIPKYHGLHPSRLHGVLYFRAGTKNAGYHINES
jgi:hypothetical protein